MSEAQIQVVHFHPLSTDEQHHKWGAKALRNALSFARQEAEYWRRIAMLRHAETKQAERQLAEIKGMLRGDKHWDAP